MRMGHNVGCQPFDYCCSVFDFRFLRIGAHSSRVAITEAPVQFGVVLTITALRCPLLLIAKRWSLQWNALGVPCACGHRILKLM